MNFITKKHLPRRTFLRGAGVAVALPLLDSMVPAQTLLSKTAASPRSRLGCIYVPHGATMDKFTPAKEGSGFEFTEILQPLEKYRDHLVVVSNLAHRQAAGIGSDAGADHARSAAVFLPELLRHDLIDGDSNVDGRFFRMSTAQEDSGGTRVVGACIASDAGSLLMRQIAHHDQMIPVFFQRLKNLRKSKPLPSFAGVNLSMVAPCGT